MQLRIWKCNFKFYYKNENVQSANYTNLSQITEDLREI